MDFSKDLVYQMRFGGNYLDMNDKNKFSHFYVVISGHI